MAGERAVPVTAGASTELQPRGERAVLLAMVIAFVLIVAYWVIWYGVDRGILASSHAAVYYSFENAFPLADGWLALALLLGIVSLIRRRPVAVLWTLLAGGAGIFLGCMDVLFDLEHGIYTTRPADNASAPLIEIALNLITFTFGGAIIVWIWRHRAAYLGTR